MIYTPEVRELNEQNVRIHDALHGIGLDAGFVRNPLEEPVAVLVRNAFDPEQVVTAPKIEQAYEQAPYVEFGSPIDRDLADLRGYFPLARSRVYPRHVLGIMDVVTRAAADTENGLAFELKSPAAPAAQATVTKGNGLGLHADYVGSHSYVDPNLPVHGLNVHATLLGSYVAELGVLRDLRYDDELVAAKRQAEAEGKSEKLSLGGLYRRLGAPFTETPVVNAGDLLIFQAEQYEDTTRKIAGTAHDFKTVSDKRLSTIFRPHLGETTAVQAKRDTLAEAYGLDN
jgi:hypothetical protein